MCLELRWDKSWTKLKFPDTKRKAHKRTTVRWVYYSCLIWPSQASPMKNVDRKCSLYIFSKLQFSNFDKPWSNSCTKDLCQYFFYSLCVNNNRICQKMLSISISDQEDELANAICISIRWYSDIVCQDTPHHSFECWTTELLDNIFQNWYIWQSVVLRFVGDI